MTRPRALGVLAGLLVLVVMVALFLLLTSYGGSRPVNDNGCKVPSYPEC